MDTTVQKKYRNALSRCRPEHARCDDFSLRHPPMQPGQRAKIFSPFSALRGFEEAIDGKRRLYVEKRELNEQAQEELDRTLSLLHARAAQGHPLSGRAACYVPCPDENHEAYGRLGSYETVTGPVRKVDPVLRRSLLIGDREIELSDISDITILEEN